MSINIHSANLSIPSSTISSSTPSNLVIVPVTSIAQEEAFRSFAPTINAQQYNQGQVDQHLLAYREGNVVARCSLWWRSVPRLSDQRVGCIGHYASIDRTAAAELLAVACTQLEAAGCTIVFGPLDGSTFRAYRLVTERGIGENAPRPPFLLEPTNPDEWADDFRAAGFTAWAEYYSDLAPLGGPDPRLAERTASLAAHGVRLRGLDPAIFSQPGGNVKAFEKELARVYPLVMTAFAHSPLFTPISDVEFLAQYAPVCSLLSPELVVLAERDGELVGFLFALPDYSQAQRGETVDTVILKTLAVLPSLAGIGLGSLLTAQIHTQAYNQGYRWAIHALMHRDNRSRRISAHTAQPFRRYTLFTHTLRPATSTAIGNVDKPHN